MPEHCALARSQRSDDGLQSADDVGTARAAGRTAESDGVLQPGQSHVRRIGSFLCLNQVVLQADQSRFKQGLSSGRRCDDAWLRDQRQCVQSATEPGTVPHMDAGTGNRTCAESASASVVAPASVNRRIGYALRRVWFASHHRRCGNTQRRHANPPFLVTSTSPRLSSA